MDLLKVDSKKANSTRSRISSTPATDAKCVSRTCKFSGLDRNNKIAVGVCAKCGCFEHFECSKTKPDEREMILKGEQNYYCSSCFSKNPAMIAFGLDKTVNIPKQLKITPALQQSSIESGKQKTFKCQFCSFETKDQSIVRKHKQENHEFLCETCKEIFTSKPDLSKHVKDHHTRPCITCKMEFQSISDLKEHMRSSHGPECTICNITFEKQDDLEKHVVEKHNGKPQSKLSCQDCPETYNSSEDLKKHIEENHKRNCSHCSHSFPSNVLLEEHIANDHGNKCTLCPFTCKDSNTLENHIREDHHSNELENHTYQVCNICDKRFSNKEEVEKHMDSDHSIKCQQCTLVFRNNETLVAHQVVHNSPSYECSICEKLFTSKDQLKDHMECEHYSDCSICGKLFKCSKELQVHLQTCKVYSCGDCNDVYYGMGDLNEHVLQDHRNKCTICLEVFTSKSKLDQHVKDEHLFKCSKCSEISESTEALNIHMQECHNDLVSVIIDDEVYECEYCDFQGQEVDVMKEHIIEIHTKKEKDGRFSCCDCDYKSKKKQELLTHFRNEHMNTGNSLNKVDNDDGEPTINIKEEYRKLKNNFERLNTMFQESLQEVDKVKSEYTAKIAEATEKYRVALKENEELKEKVDILFKLGRGYIDRIEPRKDNDTPVITVEKEKNDEVETPDDDIECLTAWATNKYRGFKRVSPTASSLRSKGPPTTSPGAATTPRPDQSSPSSPGPSTAQLSVNERLQNLAKNNPTTRPNPDVNGQPQYCHFFTNYGRCNFEEKTGKRCKFLHKTAPMCKKGLSCTRTRCMFTHPNTGGQNSPFLGTGTQFQNNQTPWLQVMNPFSNPLNFMAMNPFQMPANHPFQGQMRYQK